jgi:hypothetical protein
MIRKKAEELLAILIDAAGKLDIEVRTERLIGAGGIPVTSGLARVEDKWVIFLEKRQPPGQRVEALVEALRQFDLSELGLPEQAQVFFGGGS